MELESTGSKNETDDLLLSIKKKCETLIDQNLTVAQETLEPKFNQQMENFSFRLHTFLSSESKWMNGITSLEV